MEIKEILEITPETLAKRQKEALKAFGIEVLERWIKYIREEEFGTNFDPNNSDLEYSPAGDCMGCDNYYIPFHFANESQYEGAPDIGDLLIELSHLKSLEQRNKNE